MVGRAASCKRRVGAEDGIGSSRPRPRLSPPQPQRHQRPQLQTGPQHLPGLCLECDAQVAQRQPEWLAAVKLQRVLVRRHRRPSVGCRQAALNVAATNGQARLHGVHLRRWTCLSRQPLHAFGALGALSGAQRRQLVGVDTLTPLGPRRCERVLQLLPFGGRTRRLGRARLGLLLLREVAEAVSRAGPWQ
jgi:hypothetical protein